MRARRVFIKVCGLTVADEAAAVAEAGADAIGLVFWPGSKRAVTVDVARSIGRALPTFVTRVGVFVDETADEIARTADRAGLDVVQLHGSEPPEVFQGLPRRALKGLRVGSSFDVADALRYVDAGAGLLLDTLVAPVGQVLETGIESGPKVEASTTKAPLAAPGGTGTTFDWGLVSGLSSRVPFLVLAGGLHAGNVADALRTVEPAGVDVSSGVEQTPGRKDLAKVIAFVKAVREAESVR